MMLIPPTFVSTGFWNRRPFFSARRNFIMAIGCNAFPDLFIAPDLLRSPRGHTYANKAHDA
jgi:hypothetical protein